MRRVVWIIVILSIGSIVARMSTAGAGVQPLSSAQKEFRGHGDNYCIAVQQERNGAVHFEVFAVDSSTGALTPITAYFISVQITGQAVPVWEARETFEAVHRITYGALPPRFKNISGPEQLIPGLTYRVGVRNPGIGGFGRTFEHVGTEKRNGCR